MRQRLTSRQRDEQALHMTRLRAEGVSVADIADRLGKTTQFVSVATNRIMDADLLQSGECPSEAARCYWKVKRR